MGWPDSGYLWRGGAKPAQEQYANIAKAISEFEPLTMFANKGEVATPHPPPPPPAPRCTYLAGISVCCYGATCRSDCILWLQKAPDHVFS